MVTLNDRPSREPMRLWYTVALPAMWLGAMVSMWHLAWGVRESSMGPMLAGLAGHWLPVVLGSEGTAFVKAQCIGGVLVMAVVGLLQDYLRVPPVWAWGYLAGVATGSLLWLLASILQHPGPGLVHLWAAMLFCGCIGLYVVSVILCLVRGAMQLRRCLANRAICKGS